MQVKRTWCQEGEEIAIGNLTVQNPLRPLQNDTFVGFDAGVAAEETQISHAHDERKRGKHLFRQAVFRQIKRRGGNLDTLQRPLSRSSRSRRGSHSFQPAHRAMASDCAEDALSLIWSSYGESCGGCSS